MRQRSEINWKDWSFDNPETQVAFRICPGNHECRMGLVATREIARNVIAAMVENGRAATWAVPGCSSSCYQPQLADVGIISRRLVNEEDGTRTPRFDLVLRNDTSRLGQTVQENLPLAEVH
jgi:sulfite reductase (ferredoxin)